MPAHDIALAQAFGTRRVHMVWLQFAERRRTQETRQDARYIVTNVSAGRHRLSIACHGDSKNDT